MSKLIGGINPALQTDMDEKPPKARSDTPAQPPMLNYQSPEDPAAPNPDTDGEESRWFSYIAVGIVLASLVVGIFLLWRALMFAFRL